MAIEAVIPPKSTQTEKPKVKGRWRSAFVLSFSMMLDNNEGSSFITALFPVMRQFFGFTLADLGIINAIPKIISVIFGPIWATIGRKYNRKLVLVFVTGIWGLWAIAIGMSQTAWQLYLFLIISVIGAVASQPLVQELMTDLFNDNERGKAASVIYGLGGLVALPLFAVNGWLSTIENGWRYGFYAAGILSALSGVLIYFFMKDPGYGASEAALADVTQTRQEEYGLVNWSEVKELFQIRTFVLMLGQRLLSGHLLMLSLGIVFMVDVLGFDTQQANLMMIPLALGAISGMLTFGFIADSIHQRMPKYGRIGAIQFIQLAYAILAYFGTQFFYENTAVYMVLFFLMGFFGSANLGVNRPIIASVVRPELRGTAFALFVSVFEAIGWAIYNIVAGRLGDIYGLQPVFFVVLVLLMLVNTAFITLLYRPYAEDVQTLNDQLAARREQLIGE